MNTTTTTNTRGREIAGEIYNQLGRKAFFMMGAKNLAHGENNLQFKISGSGRVSHINIALNGLDLYDVTFYKVRGVNTKVVSKFENYYDDMLKSLIEKETGLYLSL